MTDSVLHNLLVIDSRDHGAREVLKAAAAIGARAELVSRRQAQDKLSSRRWSMVFANLESLGDGAWGFVEQIKSDRPEMPLVLTSPQPSANDVIRSMRAGCQELLIEPLNADSLQTIFDELLPNHKVPFAGRFENAGRTDCIVGASDEILRTIAVAGKVASTSMPVLVTGESGCGKELVAGYIHANSRRANGPFVKVNCAAISDTLLESELFGHERGAFTGAHQRRRGLFERANGGTLLLDEISETTTRFQAKLLRVIEEQEFQRVGGGSTVEVNVRIISTSNRDLAAHVAKGDFRRDLIYRIGALNITVPPLRQRIEDIQPLVWHFIDRYSSEVGRTISRLDEKAMHKLCSYDWPGNVRQLCGVVRTALVMSSGSAFKLDGAEHLCMGHAATGESIQSETVRLREVERIAIVEALRRTKSHFAKAADMLGITDRTLREKVRRYRRDGQLVPAGENRWLTQAT